MTDHEGNKKIYLARGIQEGLETVHYCPRGSRARWIFLFAEGSVIICFITGILLYAYCE